MKTVFFIKILIDWDILEFFFSMLVQNKWNVLPTIFYKPITDVQGERKHKIKLSRVGRIKNTQSASSVLLKIIFCCILWMFIPKLIWLCTVFQLTPSCPTEDGLQGPAHPEILRMFRVNTEMLNDPLSEARLRKRMLVGDKHARISVLVANHFYRWVTVAGACSFLGACPFCPFSDKSEVELSFAPYNIFFHLLKRYIFFHKLSGNKEFLRIAEGNVREKMGRQGYISS